MKATLDFVEEVAVDVEIPFEAGIFVIDKPAGPDFRGYEVGCEKKWRD